MGRLLITGMSGAGKSTLLGELERRGHHTVDTDYGGWTAGDGGPWHEDQMAHLLRTHNHVVVAGTAENQADFYDRFDHVILLSAPLHVLLDRVRHRTNNPYGNSSHEREAVRRHVAEVEPLLRRSADIELDGRRRVQELADVIEPLIGTEHQGEGAQSFPAVEGSATGHMVPSRRGRRHAGIVLGTAASALRLASVDDVTLEALVHVATTNAAANEVTPPSAPGDEWSDARVAWLRDYHRECRSGLTGPRGEATWAVLAEDAVIGSVRLAETTEASTLETGIWLASSARGRGLGREAIRLVLEEALVLGYTRVTADTAETNSAAIHVLQAAGFTLMQPDGRHRVRADIRLRKRTGSRLP